MKKETRTIIFDDELRVEAHRLEGIVQPFPNHFHQYYVIGLIEKVTGKRCLPGFSQSVIWDEDAAYYCCCLY